MRFKMLENIKSPSDIKMLTDDEIPAKTKNEFLKLFIQKIEFSRENNDEFVLDIYLK